MELKVNPIFLRLRILIHHYKWSLIWLHCWSICDLFFATWKMVYVTIKPSNLWEIFCPSFSKVQRSNRNSRWTFEQKKITLFIVGMWLNILGAKIYQSSYFKIYTISESILFEDQLCIVYAKMRNDFFKKP